VRQPNQKIRQYTLIQKLGDGGMGSVWLASKSGARGFTKKVCIKTMHPAALAFLDYFATEARLGGRLTHTNLINVDDFFDEGGEFFIVMEYVEGLDLRALIEKAGPMPATWAAYIAWYALKGLHHAHIAAIGGPGRGNVVHRDISPDNILISNDAEIKVTDFGIAQVEEAMRQKTQSPDAFRGKPAYVSPDYLKNPADVDARADVYQVGVLLYEMLAGSGPFSGVSSSYHLSVMIVEGQARPLLEANPKADPKLAAVAAALMRPDRNQRPASAEAARVLIYEACPNLLTAEAPIRTRVQQITKRTRRMTSVWTRPEDVPDIHMEAPHGGGVVVAATHDEATMRLTPELLAAKGTPMLPENVPVLISTRPGRVPLPASAQRDLERQSIPHPIAIDKTEALKTPSRRGAAIALGASAVVFLACGLVYMLNARRSRAGASPPAIVASAPQPAPAEPSPAPATAEQKPTPPKGSPAAPFHSTSKLTPEPTPESAPEVKPKPRHHRAAPPVAENPNMGRIVVYKEAQPISVFVDKIYVGTAPLNYDLDPGVHQVTLIRGTAGAKEPPLEVPVKVAAGGKYRLNTPEGERP
jgi:serine/threonine protein kinase